MYRVGIVTLSDKGYAGAREDISGARIRELLPAEYEVVSYRLLPDDRTMLREELMRLADDVGCDLILTTGGTGFSVRDITPEATMDVAERNAMGISEAMRAYSLSITPRAMLSRGVSVIRGRTLIVNLPGSPKAVTESLTYILPSLGHGLDILKGDAGECAGELVSKKKIQKLIVVRGGGDLATGTIHRLHRAGFRVLILEIAAPAAIRRQVSFCEAVYDGSTVVEGVEAVRIEDTAQCEAVWAAGKVPLLIDENGVCISELQPDIVVDAILAKKNLGTDRAMAPFTIALGPGFTAGEDVDVVVETKRGHNLGRIFTEGTAFPNTGIPGNIGGYTKERVMHAEAAGILYNVRSIGDVVTQGEEIARIETAEGTVSVKASISGIIRGLIRDGYPVTVGFKIADIDPREGELANCFTISDKARCIAGSVLEAVCGYYSRR